MGRVVLCGWEADARRRLRMVAAVNLERDIFLVVAPAAGRAGWRGRRRDGRPRSPAAAAARVVIQLHQDIGRRAWKTPTSAGFMRRRRRRRRSGGSAAWPVVETVLGVGRPS